MRRIVTTLFLAFGLLLGATTAAAQTVYETRGANGPVFSDKPQPGAKAIQLKPLNVIENAKLTGTDKKAEPKRPATRRLSRTTAASRSYFRRTRGASSPTPPSSRSAWRPIRRCVWPKGTHSW